MGLHERFDIIDLAKYISDKYKYSKIVLFVVSMSASTVMNASGEALTNNVKVIIEDCGYTSTWDQFAYHFYMLDEVYNACPAPKEKLIIFDAKHAKAAKVNPTLYWSTIERFLKKYI